MRFLFLFFLFVFRTSLFYLYYSDQCRVGRLILFYIFIGMRDIHNQMRVVTPELIFLWLVFCFLYFKACESFVQRTLVFILLAWARDLFLRGFAV